jgi:fatty acid desaturase
MKMTTNTTNIIDEATPTAAKGSKARGHYRKHVADLFTPNLSLYIVDFLVSYAVFIGGWYLFHTGSDAFKWLGFVVGVLAVYRAGLFIHEIVHLPKKQFKPFFLLWNLLYGMPFLLPSFMYESHLKHHFPRVYGTAGDPEYVVLDGRGLFAQIIFLILHTVASPILVIFRFTVVTALSLISAKFRRISRQRFCALAINASYVDTSKSVDTDKFVSPWEIGSFIVAVTVITGMIKGFVNPAYVIEFFMMLAAALFINGIRTLVAHCYANHELQPLTEIEQLSDSLNHVGNPIIGELLAPVGLRFHGLHHLFPTIPYHNLYEAHRRLMKELPDDDPYRAINFKSFFGAMWAMR